MQEFNTNTLVCGYIQKLLKDTYIPSVPVVANKNDAPEGLFIHDTALYQKTNDKINFISDYYFGKKLLNLSSNYISKVNYYNSDVHEALGQYLRFYRDYYNIDLMPLYNCCSNRIVTNITLPLQSATTPSISKEDVKVLALPVKYNTYYLLKINSETAVYPIVQPAFFNKTILLDIDNITFKRINITKPFFIAPPSGLGENYKQTERYLYLFIQLPADTTVESNIVVIEQGRVELSQDTHNIIIPTSHIINSTLLSNNIRKQVPFSDRLIEYLMENVIAPKISNPHDIARVRDKFKSIDLGNAAGHFTAELQQAIYNKYKTNARFTDFLGYVDKDIEWDLFGEHNYTEGES